MTVEVTDKQFDVILKDEMTNSDMLNLIMTKGVIDGDSYIPLDCAGNNDEEVNFDFDPDEFLKRLCV